MKQLACSITIYYYYFFNKRLINTNSHLNVGVQLLNRTLHLEDVYNEQYVLLCVTWHKLSRFHAFNSGINFSYEMLSFSPSLLPLA